MSLLLIPPCTPLLYSKTGVNRGIPIVLIFGPKHRLWVLVRTALVLEPPQSGSSKVEPPQQGCSNVYLLSYVFSKSKISKTFLMNIFNFYNLRKISILHGHVFVINDIANCKQVSKL